MDGGEGWRVMRYPAASQDKTIINRVMLRFRPIAPKPATDGSSSGSREPENKNCLVSNVRTKRKYVRVKKTNGYYKRKRKNKLLSDPERSIGREDDPNKKPLTLQLLPEKTDRERRSRGTVDGAIIKDRVQEKTDPPVLFNISKQVTSDLSCLPITDRTPASIFRKRMIETWVTVESVTETCMDVVGSLGSTDVEKAKNLGKDTCPGFISDSSNRVQWVNEAYRKMVMVREENDGQSVEITVGLVIKEELLPYLKNAAFTCWVKLHYTWQKEKFKQTVPCDVWRMEFGGFAWRMDIKAALSLGL